VNNSGEVTGFANGDGKVGRQNDAFLWTQAGGMVDLGTLGGTSSAGLAINNSGEVVGSSQTASGAMHAFRWTQAGGMVDLGTLNGDSFSQALAINNNGEIVGDTSSGQLVYWDAAGNIHDLGSVGVSGQSGVDGASVNDAGQIVGMVESSNAGVPSDQAFVWTPGAGSTILPGYLLSNGTETTQALAINNNGEIMGTSANPTIGAIDTVTWVAPALPTPAAPTNLTASSPAQNPQLSWTGVSNATYYNIYRNGTLIDTISANNTSYTDDSAPAGTSDTYYVTAVNAAGESGPSNSVTVQVIDPAASVGTISAPSTIAKGVSLTANAPFTYAAATDSFTATWNWGDGSSTTGTVSASGGSGNVTGAHAYAAAGSYTVTLSVTNSYGYTGTSQFTVAVSPKTTNTFKGANLSGLNYSNANLSGVDISGANVQNVTFNDANLQGTNFAGDNASGASFQNADLTNANLSGANFQRTNLTGANLTGANLKGSNFKNATVTNVTWSNTICPDNTNSNNDGLTCIGHGGGL